MTLSGASRNLRVLLCAAVFAGVGPPVRAQDSVGQTPGQSDALSAYAQQSVRYVVDGAPVLSSWGTQYLVAPLIKASRGVDPFFETNLAGASLVSPDVEIPQSFVPTTYALWTTRGRGVHPTFNAPPGSVQVSNFERRFGIGMTDFGMSDTNVVGARVGRRLLEPSRFYVTRTLACSSRATSVAPDTAVLAAGSIEALGALRLRADGVGLSQSPTVLSGDTIVRIDLPLRSAGVNAISRSMSTGLAVASDAAATAAVFNSAALSLGPPSAAPQTVVGGSSGISATLAFDNTFRRAGASTTAHLAPGIVAHRGNPSYAATPALGGAGGVFGSLGVSSAGGGRVDSVNLWAVDTGAQVVGTTSATLPPVLTAPGFTATAPEFTHWSSQTPFRGGGGQVAIGRTSAGDLLAAATARSGDAGEFIVVTNLSAPGSGWTVVAAANTPVLSGPAGAQIGKVVGGAQAGSPVTFSCPGMDFFGNVYFVATFKPNLGPVGTAFIKAVRTSGGYRLERVLATGQTIHGANSACDYEIALLTLADADSIASGSFFASSVLPHRLPGGGLPEAAQAFGGAVVNAVVRYDNNATVETYDVALFVSARTFSVAGDLNGDGSVNSIDLGQLLGSWGPGTGAADLNDDGLVNSQDLAILLGNWG